MCRTYVYSLPSSAPATRRNAGFSALGAWTCAVKLAGTQRRTRTRTQRPFLGEHPHCHTPPIVCSLRHTIFYGTASFLCPFLSLRSPEARRKFAVDKHKGGGAPLLILTPHTTHPSLHFTLSSCLCTLPVHAPLPSLSLFHALCDASCDAKLYAARCDPSIEHHNVLSLG